MTFIYKPSDFYSFENSALHGCIIKADGHTQFTEDTVRDLNNFRRGFLEERDKVKELTETNKEQAERLKPIEGVEDVAAFMKQTREAFEAIKSDVQEYAEVKQETIFLVAKALARFPKEKESN